MSNCDDTEVWYFKPQVHRSFDKGRQVGYSLAVKTLSGTATSLMQSSAARRWLQIITISLVLLFFGLALYSQAPEIVKYRWVVDPIYLALAFVLLVARGPIVVLGWWS